MIEGRCQAVHGGASPTKGRHPLRTDGVASKRPPLRRMSVSGLSDEFACNIVDR